MRKVPGVVAVEFGHPWGDNEHAETVAQACLEFRNIRRNARRGLVGTRPDARDERGIADVPQFNDLGDAWTVLNWFCELGTDNELRQLFFGLLDPSALHWNRLQATVVTEIMDCAITALLHGRKRGWI